MNRSDEMKDALKKRYNPAEKGFSISVSISSIFNWFMKRSKAKRMANIERRLKR